MTERRVIKRIEELLGKKVRKMTYDKAYARYEVTTVDGEVHKISDLRMNQIWIREF